MICTELGLARLQGLHAELFRVAHDDQLGEKRVLTLGFRESIATG